MIPEISTYTYEERCARLKLFTLEYRRTRADLIMTFKIIRLRLHPELHHLLTLNTETRTRGHTLKLLKPQCNRLSTVYRFSTQTISYWNSLPEMIVLSDSVRLFKKNLDEYLWFQTLLWKNPAVPGAPYPRTPAAYG